LMVLDNGLEKAGIVDATKAATNAALRTNDWIFMRVILPFENRVSRRAVAVGKTVDTQCKGEYSRRQTPLLPGLTAGKTACHCPAAATAGFFISNLEQPRNQLHWYRRMHTCECFAHYRISCKNVA
jgi:hypothetical protein